MTPFTYKNFHEAESLGNTTTPSVWISPEQLAKYYCSPSNGEKDNQEGTKESLVTETTRSEVRLGDDFENKHQQNSMATDGKPPRVNLDTIHNTPSTVSRGSNLQDDNTDSARSKQLETATLGSDSTARSKELLKRAEKLLGRAIEAIRSANEKNRQSEASLPVPTLNHKDAIQGILEDSTSRVSRKLSVGSSISGKSEEMAIETKTARYNGKYWEYPDPELGLSLISSEPTLESILGPSREWSPGSSGKPENLSQGQLSVVSYKGEYSEYPDPGLYLSLISTDPTLESILGPAHMSISGSPVTADSDRSSRRQMNEPPHKPQVESSVAQGKTENCESRVPIFQNSVGSTSPPTNDVIHEAFPSSPSATKTDSVSSPLTPCPSERLPLSGNRDLSVVPRLRDFNQNGQRHRGLSEGSYSQINVDTSRDGLFTVRGHDSISTLSHASADMKVDLRHCRPLQLDGVDYLLVPVHIVQPRSILKNSRRVHVAQDPHSTDHEEQDQRIKAVRFGGPNGNYIVDEMPAPKSCFTAMFSRSKSSPQEKQLKEDQYSYGTPHTQYESFIRSPEAQAKNGTPKAAESPLSILDFPSSRHSRSRNRGADDQPVEI